MEVVGRLGEVGVDSRRELLNVNDGVESGCVVDDLVPVSADLLSIEPEEGSIRSSRVFGGLNVKLLKHEKDDDQQLIREQHNRGWVRSRSLEDLRE